jgi:hypothetical protein
MVVEKSEAACHFSAARQMVYDWLKRPCLSPERCVCTKFKIDRDVLRSYVAENKDAYLSEIGSAFSVGATTGLKLAIKKSHAL